MYEELLQFSSSEISDALDGHQIEGALFGIKPINLHCKIVGPAYTVQYSPFKKKPKEFQQAGNYIDNVPPNAIIVIDNHGQLDCTTWGNILTEVAISKRIRGTVVNGAIRDVDFIKQVRYPIYSAGVYMRSGKNRVYKSDEQCQIEINQVTINPNDIIFADNNGVLVIPNHLVQEVIHSARNIRQTESKILRAVKSGKNLEQAREEYGYDKPWES